MSSGDIDKGEDKDLSKKKYLLYCESTCTKTFTVQLLLTAGCINWVKSPLKTDLPNFLHLLTHVKKICGAQEFVFGLEDTRGFGRNLSAYLVGRKFDVKHVNPAYTSAVRLSNPIAYKDDAYYAYCVARVLRDMVDGLPNAKHEDIFWTIRQLVKRRDLLVKNNVMNKNTLHNQLMYSYPSYRKFFAEIDGKSALRQYTFKMPRLKRFMRL